MSNMSETVKEDDAGDHSVQGSSDTSVSPPVLQPTSIGFSLNDTTTSAGYPSVVTSIYELPFILNAALDTDDINLNPKPSHLIGWNVALTNNDNSESTEFEATSLGASSNTGNTSEHDVQRMMSEARLINRVVPQFDLDYIYSSLQQYKDYDDRVIIVTEKLQEENLNKDRPDDADEIINQTLEPHIKQLLDMFPDADLEYLKHIYMNSSTIDEAIETLLQTPEYPRQKNQPISKPKPQSSKRTKVPLKRLMSLLPHANPEFLSDTWFKIGHDTFALQNFIEEQFKENDKKSKFENLTVMFPEADPQFLLESCDKIGEDENAMKEFINDQIQKNKIENQCKTLQAMFPHLDPTVLKEKCLEIGSNEEELRTFITEQIKQHETDEKYQNLLAMLPDVDPTFLREAVETIGDDKDAMKDFVKTQLDEMSTVSFQTLLSMLPDADPEYLRDNYCRLGSKKIIIKAFILECMESNDYPTMDDYLKRKEQRALKRKYNEGFDIEEFIDNIPDPFEHFTDEENELDNEKGRRFSLAYLEKKYKTIPLEQIVDIFVKNKHILTLTCHELDMWAGELQPERETFTNIIPEDETTPVPFLQEVAFLENEAKIRKFLDEKEERKNLALVQAKQNGTLLECVICCDDCVMPEDSGTCSGGEHTFCKACIRKGAEVAIGDGKNKIECFMKCGAEFNIRVLQMALRRVTLLHLLKRKQLEEVQAAGIEGLESCPFCNFASIPPEGDKTFRCLNPECMKESCRKCHKRSHLPLRCEEVETKDQVRMRLYIEDRMTDALVRTCWKCGKKFVKETGCNRMTCSCGASMCYICRQPITDYTHFNGPGGDAYEKCELFSADEVIHDEAVRREGLEAKNKILEDNPDLELKHDPTKEP